MSSEKDKVESSVASDGYADDGMTAEQRTKLLKALETWPPGEPTTPEKSAAETGIPVSFFLGTWRDDPEYMAKRVTPFVDRSAAG